MKKLVNTTILVIWVGVVFVALYFALSLDIKPDPMEMRFQQQLQHQR